MLQLAANRAITLVCGISGSGKSTFAVRYLVAERDLACRFIFDYKGEFAERLQLTAAETPEEMSCAIEDGFVIFDPHRLFPGRLGDALDWFSKWVYAASERLPGAKVCLIDEVWKFCDPHKIPESLADCVQTGRKGGLSMIFTTQRPNRLNECITNEVTELVSFRLRGRSALKCVEELGADPEEVKALPIGAFVAVAENGSELRGRLW